MINVIPLNDLKDHTDNDCLCKPKIEIVNNVTLVIHNSFDCRELTEKDVIFMLN